MKVVLLCGTVLLAAGMGQRPSTPPVKMGLWESTSHVELTAGKGLPPTNSKASHCYSADTWAKSPITSGCHVSNESWSAQGYSYDLDCPNEHNMPAAHMQVDFLSAESMHAVAHVKSSHHGHEVGVVTIDEHFVSADCGSVSPSKPDIMP